MRNIILLSIICLLSFTSNLLSQSLDELELRYDNLRSVVEKDNLILDSLKNILENRAKQIENEKQKPNPDNEKVIKLMAGSVSLSNTIDDHQEELETDTKNLKQLSEMLEVKYSAKIDSLKLLKKSGKENFDKLDGEILLYTEKRLLISPQVDMLSFNPQKILEVDLKKAKTIEEKLLLKEYLSNALAEVNLLLSDVTKQSEEISEALTLQRKTSKFLTETEFDRNVGIDRISRSSSQRTSLEISLSGKDNLTIADQINSYTLLLDQLNIFDKSEGVKTNKFNHKPGTTNFSLKDYSELLKEIRQRLNDYKLILANRIEQSR
ncbi:MAG: hypothetical protein A2W11_06085 [Ignavibacteria bacterium RBG_16_35_7]|nr:MAG: hypothetical protein A2W11_06085 [Ignavibacteria bacterium RBG_16_35_7]